MLKKLLQGLKALRGGDSDPDWSYEERRDLIRMRCHYEVEYRFDGKKYPGQIVDMSLGGMKLRCFQPPPKDATVEVTYSVPALDIREQTVPCRVSWVRGRERDFVHFVGLAYDASDDVLKNSWVKMVLKQLGFNPKKIYQRRKFIRADCFIPAQIIYQRVKVMEGRLYNLGAMGALVETQAPLEKGEFVELHIGPLEDMPRLDISGTVVQVTKQHGNVTMGIEFGKLSDRATERLGRYLKHLLIKHWTE